MNHMVGQSYNKMRIGKKVGVCTYVVVPVLIALTAKTKPVKSQ